MAKLSRPNFAAIKVQDAVKSHNDAVLASNVAVNKVNENLNSAFSIIDKHMSNVDNLFQERDIKNQKQREELDLSLMKMNNQIGILATLIDTQRKDTEKGLQQHIDRFVSLDTFKTGLEMLANVTEAVDEKVDGIRDTVRQDLSHELNTIKERHRVFSSEISKFPDLVHALKQDLLKKIEIHAIDSAALLTELRSHKNDLFVLQKHIEDLYTKLDRLTKGNPS